MSYGPWEMPTAGTYATVYDGPCAHDGKGESDRVRRPSYGTAYCPKCTASQGLDGVWRVMVEDTGAET